MWETDGSFHGGRLGLIYVNTLHEQKDKAGTGHWLTAGSLMSFQPLNNYGFYYLLEPPRRSVTSL